jgi:superfamily I DNA/RNA helicase/Zn-dependent peptidase ImmA (M78 family)
MPLTSRWPTIQQLAAAQRAQMLTAAAGPPRQLVEQSLTAHGLDVFPLPPGDPLLGGARAVFDGEFVAYDGGLPATAATFSLAHELGHKLLHDEQARCAAADIDEECAAFGLDAAPGGVETYSPRQQRELEANAFAAAFLMPAAELRAGFLAGLSYPELAARCGVSESAILNTLSATLLAAPPAGPVPAPPAAPAGPPLRLDASQEAAATVAEGPVLIDAGPGTGKTRTLIERVLFLLRNGVAPQSILALTFSNRAAGEMRERLRLAAPAAADEITVGTFHAFCLQFLQEHAAEAGLPPDFTLVDSVQAAAWLEPHLPEMALQHYTTLANPARSLPDILDAVSRARDELKDAADYADLATRARAAADPDDAKAVEQAERWAEVARVYAVYERVLEQHGALDFGALLLRTVRLLDSHPALLLRLQRRYRQILVDEYQDMNRASGVLLSRLAGDGRGLWVVGDLRQAIYRFRGASPANIDKFETDFPLGRRLRLSVNYRSDPAIVGLFTKLGGEMKVGEQGTAHWDAHRPAQPGPRIWQATANTGAAEAAGIADAVRNRYKAGRPYREQVVLCRTHGQAALVARALEAADVPTLYLGNILEREEVRDVLALVSLAAEGDGRALLRAARLTGHAVDRRACAHLVGHARREGISFPRALHQAAGAGLDPETTAACAALAAIIADAGRYGDAAGFLARYLFGPTSPLRTLLAGGGARAVARLLALGQLLALARSFQAPSANAPAGEDSAPADPAAPLREFLAHVRRLYAAKEVPGRTPPGGEDVDAVRVLTVHASKGLEFPVVYLPGLAAGRFPFREMWEPCPAPPGLIDGAEESDHDVEETCLFFVALSRARDELILSRAERYGKQKAKDSPFWTMIDPFFQETPVPMLKWQVTEEPAPPASAAPVGEDRLTLPVEDLELYLRCPRQYEYSRALRLDDSDENDGYRRFHRVVQTVLGRLREDHKQARLPAHEAAVLDLLAGAWETDGPQGHVHEALYAEAARHVVVATWQRLRATPPADPAPMELSLELGGATVRARYDLAERRPDQGVRLVRTRVGKPRDEDRKALRLALLRAAARHTLGAGVPLTIELEYLGTGETVEVADAGRYEQQRLDKLEGAVQGIRAGHFPPAPAEADECLRCPFWIICPA